VQFEWYRLLKGTAGEKGGAVILSFQKVTEDTCGITKLILDEIALTLISLKIDQVASDGPVNWYSRANLGLF